MSLKTKKRVPNCSVVSILLYGSEWQYHHRWRNSKKRVILPMNIKNTMDNVSYKEMLNKLRTTKKLIFTISYEHKHLNVRYYRPNCPKRNNFRETFTVTSLRNKNFEKQFNFKICIYFFWIFILKRNKLKFKITSFSGAKYTV